MAEQAARIYNDAVMRFIKNTKPSEQTIQQWEQEYPKLRFREYGHNRTGPLANINKSIESFMYGRPYDREELPDAWRRHGWANLFNSLNSFRPGRVFMGRFNAPRTQDNINPSTGQGGFINPIDFDNMARTASMPPSSDALGLMTRLDARNSMRTSSAGQPQVLRENDLSMYIPELDNYIMQIDRLVGNRGGPGGNILVPANRTPTQNYTAAEIIQQNPELARHLGLLDAIRGK